MNEAKEISIVIKGDESKMTKKFLVYEEMTVSCMDPVIRECIREMREEYKGDIDSVTATIKLEIME